MEPLKEMFNEKFYKLLADKIVSVEKKFDKKNFLKELCHNLSERSLNERMRHTSIVLNKQLNMPCKKALHLFYEVIPQMPGGYTNLLFPDYVGLYGKNDLEASLEALKFFTQFGSSEFAIREFLKTDFDKTLKEMHNWAEDENTHVRRLASEGSRPRLPWSFKLDEVIRKPHLTEGILTRLNKDPELYVRKSVANHLNDISKDNADYMIMLLKSWNKQNPHTAWIVKHASRSLIKKGHSDSLALFDFEKNAKVNIENFKLKAKKLKLGQNLEFSADIVSLKNSTQKLVIDYVLHYRKKNNELSPKVFKLTEIELAGKQRVLIRKKQLIKDFSTRKHFTGIHKIQLQVNGTILTEEQFHLDADAG